MRSILVVMVKEPHPGRVKTRLGAGMGMVGAAWWYRHQVARLLRQVDDPRWELVLAVSPDAEGLESRIWPGHIARVAQGPGDLGDRMRRQLRGLPGDRVCVIGSDIPGIRRHHIARGFAALGSHDAVLGPSEDGGYWMVGAKPWRVPAGLFEGVRWSSAYALEDTLHSLRGRSVGQVDVLRDVDTVADL